MWLGVATRLSRRLDLGLVARYVGSRFLRGDEADEEEPLRGYWTADARLGFASDRWSIVVLLRNVHAADYETFGTFNINRGAGGQLERFLTPGARRALNVVLRRRLASNSALR